MSICINCHEPTSRMLIMALLADLGCKGSCERVAECPNAEEEGGGHELWDRDKLETWTVRVSWAGNPSGFNDIVYTPKGTKLTDVWRYAKKQHRGKVEKILGKGWIKNE